MFKAKEENAIRQMRTATKALLIERISWRIDQGLHDAGFRHLLDGDDLKMTLSIDIIPNDIIFFRNLLGLEITDDIKRVVKKQWEMENIVNLRQAVSKADKPKPDVCSKCNLIPQEGQDVFSYNI